MTTSLFYKPHYKVPSLYPSNVSNNWLKRCVYNVFYQNEAQKLLLQHTKVTAVKTHQKGSYIHDAMQEWSRRQTQSTVWESQQGCSASCFRGL